MTEIRTDQTTTDRPTWTVAKPTTDWSALVESCSLFVLPSSVAEWYVIDDDGLLYANGVNENAFRALWQHLTSLEKSLPRAMGNAMNYAELTFGDDLLDELMIASGRRESTLRQYKRVYNPRTGIAPERQRPDIKYSYDREVCPLPPDQQETMLDRIEAGEFENSSQVHAERKRIQREPPAETFKPELPVVCPICGGHHGFKRETLEWSECSDCGAHGIELALRLQEVHAAIRALLGTGDVGLVRSYAANYHL